MYAGGRDARDDELYVLSSSRFALAQPAKLEFSFYQAGARTHSLCLYIAYYEAR